MNGTDILKVYSAQMKKYGYRLHLMCAVAPERVLENLKDLNEDANIGFEEESQNYSDEKSEIIREEKSKDTPDFDFNEEEDDEVQIIGGLDQE
jgi:hypothetical protein